MGQKLIKRGIKKYLQQVYMYVHNTKPYVL